MKLNQERYADLVYMFGHNRTGKTSIAIELVKQYKKVKGRTVVGFDPQNRFKDLLDVKIYEESWADYLEYHDILFVLDDYRGLMTANTIDNDFLKLLALRDEHGFDFIFISHNVSMMHERISYYITNIYLFYTQGDEKSFSNKINNVELIIKCRRFINEYVKQNGKGTYPKFPHLKIDMIDNKVTLININKKLVKINKDK